MKTKQGSTAEVTPARLLRTSNVDWAAGFPKFISEPLEQLSQRSGTLAAWKAAWATHGAAAAAQAHGEFAFTLWDGPGRALLAVDRFAMRTLCYRVRDGRLMAAERADQLADENHPLDPQALFDYLYFHAIPSPRTVYQGIFRLPPGHCLRFENGQITVEPYWIPEFTEPTGAISFDALSSQFRSLMCDAVRSQLDGSKPACFLSGGTDSSTVAGMIREATGSPAACYSIGFDADGYDEMSFARLAARHFGAEHHEYYITPDDLVRSIPEVAASYDQPFGNSSALPAYYCGRLARADGVTRILAGDGGDELFGGNSRYAKQRVFNAYGHIPAPLRIGVLEPLAGMRAMSTLPGFRKVKSYIAQARPAMPARLESYNLLLRMGLQEALAPEFLAMIDTSAPARQQAGVWRGAITSSALNRQLAFDWRYTLAENDLPKVYGTAALAGLEVGFPMLDGRLLDFSLALPASYKLRGMKLRWFFKESLRGFLPDEILTKKKQGFGLPFGTWATRHAGLRNLAGDTLSSLAARGLIQPRFIDRLLAEYLPAHPGYYGEMVWILVMLEQWLTARAPSFRLR